LDGTSDPWSAFTDIWSVASKIPYWKLAFDGVSKVHVLTTDMHPVQGQSSLFHLCVQVDSAGTPSYKKSDATACGGSTPFGPSDVTLVYDGTSERCWVSDATIDSDGNPRALFMVYPNNNGTVIEIWHARWDGSQWVKSFVIADGSGLYSPEIYYHGGAAFDSQDANRIAVSVPVSGVRQVRELTSSDSGATWTPTRDLTSGGTAGNPLQLRPYSPRNHNGELRWLWNRGSYTTFTNYNTAVWGAG
jgi:hypothetical protein